MQETASDLVELAYSCDRESGHPLLFVHGFSHNRYIWQSIAEELAPRLCPYFVDLRGHGDSEWSLEGRYSPSDYARDLPGLLDRLALDRVTLVGHSLGGLASALFTAQHPERVEGLVLVDTGSDLSLAALGRIASDAGSAPQDFESAAAYERWLAGILPLAPRTELAAFAEKAVVKRLDGRFELKIDPAALSPDQDSVVWEKIAQEVDTALGSIQCPVLVVRGGLSALLSQESAEQLVRHRLPRARLVTLEKAGHAVMLDDGPGLSRVIDEFAQEVVGRRPGVRVTEALASGQSYGSARTTP